MEILRKNRLKKTDVYDTYWRFACERQNIFLKRLSDWEADLTSDPILKHYKFTNTYRVNDRVSQYLIRNVIYSDAFNEEDLLFRILLFKIFNKIETWEKLKLTLGEITYKNFDIGLYSKVLDDMFNNNERIYSGAYIMSSGKHFFGNKRKYLNHLYLISMIMKDKFSLKVKRCKSLEDVFILLKKYPTIGDFLAYQYAIDINYSDVTSFDENDFVMPGPGAKAGIRKCFFDIGSYTESDVIKYMVDNQEYEFQKLGLDFFNLWGRDLKLIDCQNIFCETDKYAREKHPDIMDKNGRKRIKQIYKKNTNKIDYMYPPKWNIVRS
ncbi:MAG: hypothetical protein E7262_00610 [Lachnospiraceae bacterium]|nr:hypothetical protein [Lachnospiraceae bacterium]